MKRYKSIKIFLLILCMCQLCILPRLLGSAESTKTKATATKEKVYHVVLDPGHGGSDHGADGFDKEESKLCLTLAKYIKQELENYENVEVTLTRTKDEDVDLDTRNKVAKKAEADLLVSLHLNSISGRSSSDWSAGVSVIVPRGSAKKTLSKEGQKLGCNFLYELSEIGLKNNGLITRKSMDTYYDNGKVADYYANIRYSVMNDIVACIVEQAFIDNESDFDNYLATKAGLKKLATADAKAIVRYLGLKKADTGEILASLSDYKVQLLDIKKANREQVEKSYYTSKEEKRAAVEGQETTATKATTATSAKKTTEATEVTTEKKEATTKATQKTTAVKQTTEATKATTAVKQTTEAAKTTTEVKQTTEAVQKEKIYKVVLDPGHGGNDNGARWFGTDESEICLTIAKKMKTALEAYDNVEVVLTRTEDVYVDFDARNKTAVDEKADIFVSLHINSLEGSSDAGAGSGAEVIVPRGSYRKALCKEGQKLGCNFMYELTKVGLADNGLLMKKSKDEYYPNGKKADYYANIRRPVLNNIVSCIVEHAFVDNRADYNNYLSDDAGLQVLADADTRAIVRYLGLKKKDNGEILASLNNYKTSVYNIQNYNKTRTDRVYYTEKEELRSAVEGKKEEATTQAKVTTENQKKAEELRTEADKKQKQAEEQQRQAQARKSLLMFIVFVCLAVALFVKLVTYNNKLLRERGLKGESIFDLAKNSSGEVFWNTEKEHTWKLFGYELHVHFHGDLKKSDPS